MKYIIFMLLLIGNVYANDIDFESSKWHKHDVFSESLKHTNDSYNVTLMPSVYIDNRSTFDDIILRYHLNITIHF